MRSRRSLAAEKYAERRSDGTDFVRKSKIRVICRTPGVAMCRGSSMSCHAGQGTRAGEHLQHEGVRSRKQGTAPRLQDYPYINAPRRIVWLRRSAHTVPLQP